VRAAHSRQAHDFHYIYWLYSETSADSPVPAAVPKGDYERQRDC
jgi:hypothetical protein